MAGTASARRRHGLGTPEPSDRREGASRPLDPIVGRRPIKAVAVALIRRALTLIHFPPLPSLSHDSQRRLRSHPALFSRSPVASRRRRCSYILSLSLSSSSSSSPTPSCDVPAGTTRLPAIVIAADDFGAPAAKGPSHWRLTMSSDEETVEIDMNDERRGCGLAGDDDEDDLCEDREFLFGRDAPIIVDADGDDELPEPEPLPDGGNTGKRTRPSTSPVWDDFEKLYTIVNGKRERRRKLKPEMVEMLTCIKDWEAAELRLQQFAEDSTVALRGTARLDGGPFSAVPFSAVPNSARAVPCRVVVGKEERCRPSSSINVPIHRHHRRRWVRLQMAFDQPAGGHSSGPARGGIPMPPDVGSPARLTAPAPSTHGPTPRHLPRPPFPLLSASLYIYPLPPLPPTLLFLTQDSNSKNPREREKVPSPASLQFAKPLPNPNPDGRHRLRRCPRPGAGRVHAPTPPAGAGGHSTPSRRLRRSGRRGAVRGSEAGVLAAARTPSFRLWFLERWMCHVMLEEEEDVRFRSFLQTQETSPSPCSPRVGRYDELKRHLVGLVAEAAGEEGDKLHCAIALVRAAYAIVRLAHWCYPNAALPPLPLEQKFEAVVQESLGELTPLLGFDILAPEVGEGEAVLIKGVIMAVNVASAAARTARYIQGCASVVSPAQGNHGSDPDAEHAQYTRITRLLVPSSISRPCTRSLLNMMRNAMMLSSEFEVFLASGRGFRWWRRIKKTHNRMTVARRRSRATRRRLIRMWVTEAMPRSAPRNDVMFAPRFPRRVLWIVSAGISLGPQAFLVVGRPSSLPALQRPIGNVVESGGDGETSPFATFNSTPIKVRGLGRLLVFLLAPREQTAGSDKIAADEPVVTCVKGPAHQYYRISPPQPSLVGSGALLHRPRCTHKPSAVMWRDKRATSHATSPSPGQRELEAASEMDGSDGTGPAINLHLAVTLVLLLCLILTLSPPRRNSCGGPPQSLPRALSSETSSGGVRVWTQETAAGPVVHLGGGGAAVPGSGMISAAMGSLLFGVHGGYLASAGYNTMPTDAMLAAADAGGEQQQLPAGGGNGGVQRPAPQQHRGAWTEEEDETLKEMVTLYGERKWAVISQHLPGRIGKQCRERWTNHLRPAMWTEEDDRALIAWHRVHGNRWSGRSENAVKNHWNATRRSLKAKRRLKKKKNVEAPPGQWTELESYIRDLSSGGGAEDNVAPPDPPADFATVAAATGFDYSAAMMGMYLAANSSSSSAAGYLGDMVSNNTNMAVAAQSSYLAGLNLNAYYGVEEQQHGKPTSIYADAQANNAANEEEGHHYYYGRRRTPGRAAAPPQATRTTEFLIPTEEDVTLKLAAFIPVNRGRHLLHAAMQRRMHGVPRVDEREEAPCPGCPRRAFCSVARLPLPCDALFARERGHALYRSTDRWGPQTTTPRHQARLERAVFEMDGCGNAVKHSLIPRHFHLELSPRGSGSMDTRSSARFGHGMAAAGPAHLGGGGAQQVMPGAGMIPGGMAPLLFGVGMPVPGGNMAQPGRYLAPAGYGAMRAGWNGGGAAAGGGGGGEQQEAPGGGVVTRAYGPRRKMSKARNELL
ncbi:hypothetical protein HU200_004946 [Digitaria exilis]|uniref:Uncharacterized protein n=1 Tax=Digitaria exilis TaxID=1010633 RepID=A0A835FV98_9POAL|nr:hypothetical protein HU200_004946 [Digitaria exilis]